MDENPPSERKNEVGVSGPSPAAGEESALGESAGSAGETAGDAARKNEVPVEPPAPKQKRSPGRPVGAKDKAPRKKPVRKIVVEPLEPQSLGPEPKSVEPPSAPVAAPVTPEPEPYQPEPPSPGTLKRYHRDALFHAERLEREEKRRRIQESIFSRLHVFPR